MPDSAFVAPEQFGYVVVIGGLLRSMAKADGPRDVTCILRISSTFRW